MQSPGAPHAGNAETVEACEAAQRKIAATIRMVQAVLSTKSAKEMQRAAYKGLAATFTMVQVRHTVKYIHAYLRAKQRPAAILRLAATFTMVKARFKCEALRKPIRVLSDLRELNKKHAQGMPPEHRIQPAMSGASVRAQMGMQREMQRRMLYDTAQLKLRKMTEEAAHRNESWDQIARYESTRELQYNLLQETQSVTTKRWHELLRNLLMRGEKQYAGWRERALYTAVAALQSQVLSGIQTARNALLKMTGTYSVWRQLLEDKMHKMVLRWRTSTVCLKSTHRSKWWVMAAMWKRQLGSLRTRFLREWSANSRKAPKMQHRAMPGVMIFLNSIVRRRIVKLTPPTAPD